MHSSTLQCIYVLLYVQVCNLVLSNVDHLAIRGDDLSSLLVIEDTGNQVSEFTSSVIVRVEGELLMFIGTQAGTLLKV